ncbi:MAG: 4Fe-4S dicluster domain-containing protein [Candidatus Hodarchaeales archaeon]
MTSKKTISDKFLGPDAVTKVPRYTIHVIKDRCKGCEICTAFCPREILVLSKTEFNAKGYHPPQLKEGESAENCSGCLFCQLACPEFAIYIREE